MSSLILLLIIALATTDFQLTSALHRKRYDGYKVYSVKPSSQAELDFFYTMMTTDSRVDFWQSPSHRGQLVTFMVAPHDQQGIEMKLRRRQIRYSVQTNDVQRSLLRPMWMDIEGMRRSDVTSGFNLNNFNKLEDITDWMLKLATQCRPGLTCKCSSIGTTHEGRPIYLFEMSKKSRGRRPTTGSKAGRKAYWVDGTIHAREWITTATIVNIMDRMARGANAAAIRLTDSYDWYFLPVMNPDGYSYTWTDDRMWRKNRRPAAVGKGSCVGVDLNRNFNYSWATIDVSHDPCSIIYCGPSAASEPETRAVQDTLVRLAPSLAATVTMHAFGRLWMFPFGDVVPNEHHKPICHRSADYNDLMRVATVAATAVQKTFNTTWNYGNSCEVIYPAAGGTDDFAKGVAGVKYAFCLELRDTNFIIQSSQIAPSTEEIWNGIVAMCDAIKA